VIDIVEDAKYRKEVRDLFVSLQTHFFD
jgi:hypothetical protein